MADSGPSRIVPVAIGMALTAVLLVFIAYVNRTRSNAATTLIPTLTITAPPAGTEADSPLVVRFTSDAPVRLGKTGWGYERLHLHATVNDVQHMPAAADIHAVDSLSYAWTLPAVPRGTIRLNLGWADAAHRPLTRGVTDTISLLLR